jgi:multiple sugar transport system permease protein
MFSDADLYFFDSIRATAVYTVLNVPASLLVSLLVALVLNKTSAFAVSFVRYFTCRTIIPQVATCIVWLWLLNQHNTA